MTVLPLSAYTTLATLLFVIGVTGVLIKRNPLIIFMSIELMLNSGNLLLVAFSRYLGYIDGQIYAFFVITVAAAEVAVGLAIIVSVFKRRRRVDVDDINIMRW